MNADNPESDKLTKKQQNAFEAAEKLDRQMADAIDSAVEKLLDGKKLTPLEQLLAFKGDTQLTRKLVRDGT